MRAYACFETADGQRCALDVAHVGAVLPAAPLEPLPAPLPAVLGLLRTGEGLMPVLGTFGQIGSHIVVIRAQEVTFGLLVAIVTGVVRIHPEQLTPAPPGQARRVVTGVAGGAAGGALVLDPEVLATGLAP